jgi:hypothetical protein
MTAAGFPAKRRVVKASTWNIGTRMEDVRLQRRAQDLGKDL